MAISYIAHERVKDAPLCRPGWKLPSGPHLFAVGEPVTCNDCQRRRVSLDNTRKIDKEARRKARKRLSAIYPVPANPVRSTRRDRADQHHEKMVRKGHRRAA